MQIIVINSGHHDRDKLIPHFEHKMKSLFSFLKGRYGSLELNHAPHIIWKGNMIGCGNAKAINHLQELDAVRRRT